MKRASLLMLAWCGAAAAALAGVITVSPNPAHVLPGGTVRFSTSPVAAPVSWRVFPARLGTIDAAGNFSAAGRPGRGIIRAIATDSDGTELVGHAAVLIDSDALRRLQVAVSPAAAALRPGETVAFAARASNADGEASGSVTWRVVPPELGTIGQDGMFTAGVPGVGRVVAAAADARARGIGQARIAVTATGPARRLSVTISPKRVRLAPGGTAAFTAAVRDQDGHPVAAALRFTVEPPAVGSIGADGAFAAGAAGTGIVRVVATAGPAVGSDRALVTVAGRTTQYLVRLTPRQAVLRTGGSVQYTAEAFDGDGRPVPVTGWRWQVIPDRMGTITPGGLFTAGERAMAGRITVRLPAGFGAGSATAALRIRPGSPNSVTIDPAKAVVRPGELRQFSAAVTGPDGEPRPDARVVWKVYPPGIGAVTPQGLFTAAASPRLGVVIAQVPPDQGGGRGVASIAVSSYTVHILGPRPRNLASGEMSQFTAEVRDAGGNPPPGGVTMQWSRISASPNFGTIDPATGWFTAGTPLAAQVDGMVYVRAMLNGQLIGGDGIRVYVHR